MNAREKQAVAAHEQGAKDGKTFYQRYLESAVQVEGRFYFHPGGIVSSDSKAPTRDEVIAYTMTVPHVVVDADGGRHVSKPTREEATAMYDGAAARYLAGPQTPPLSKPVAWRDRGGHLHRSTPITVFNADGTSEEWPALELRETQ